MAERGHAGKLLVANPLLPDPNFDRTVVLLLVHGEEGALGVVLNRPSRSGLDESLPDWEVLASAPPVVFVGGPVSPNAVICLAQVSAGGGPPSWSEEDGEADRDRWTAIAGDLGTLDLDLDPERVAGDLRGLRVFAGYAGWGAGQLEAEIAAGAWWVLDAMPDDAFCTNPDDLWRKVLRRQGGKLALVSWYPDDPSLN